MPRSACHRSPQTRPSPAEGRSFSRRRHPLASAIAIATVAAWLPIAATAQDPPASTAAGDPAAGDPAATVVELPLADALARAAEHNPDLLAARAVAEAARLRAEAAGRTHLPRLGLEAGVDVADRPSMVFATRLDAGDFGAGDFALDRLNDPDWLAHGGLAVSLELPLDLFGQLATAARAARAGAEVPAAEARAADAEVARAVVEAWGRAALADELVATATAAHQAAVARERDFAERVAAGASLQADLLRVRAARRAREAELVARRAERDEARAILTRLVAAPAGTLYAPPTAPAATTTASPLGALETLVAEALAGRPELAAARARRTAADLGRQLLDREKLPQTGLWASVRDDRLGLSTDRQSGALGVSLRWSLLDPTRKSRSAAAGAEVVAADAALTAAGDQIRLEVTRAWQAAAAARARLDAAAGGTAEGREALRVVRERRESGLATLTDELETETAALAAETTERAAAILVTIADAALDRAVGRPASPISPPSER